ncbi:hypothetical protein KEM48_000651 [Puccinia striiformis f. sp. tritici PST-130]|nr:hypothetical protein KEM48_000651 [Puccinia striiformis f. sp. tritici PST-130]
MHQEVINTIPKKLEWQLSNTLKASIRFAETRLSDSICQMKYWRSSSKITAKIHHLSKPISRCVCSNGYSVCYFSLYGRIKSIYEPAMTKAFSHGRTEGIRSVSNCSIKFIKTFCSDFDNQAKISALREASEKLPKIFRDSGYGLLNHSTLGTSNCGNAALRLFGFAPVVSDGYGIGYIIKEDGLSFVISSKHLQTRRFVEA